MREYWIVSPEGRNVQAHHLQDGGYVVRACGDADTVAVSMLEDCRIDLAAVFPPVPADVPKGPDHHPASP